MVENQRTTVDLVPKSSKTNNTNTVRSSSHFERLQLEDQGFFVGFFAKSQAIKKNDGANSANPTQSIWFVHQAEVRISLEAQLSQLRQISKTLGQRSQLVIFKMKLLGGQQNSQGNLSPHVIWHKM